MDEYHKQAKDFAEKYNIKMKIVDTIIENNTFWGDNVKMSIVKISRNRKYFTAKYHLLDYDYYEMLYNILVVLSAYQDFTYQEYIDNIAGLETPDVLNEYKEYCRIGKHVLRLFPDILEELHEIY